MSRPELRVGSSAPPDARLVPVERDPLTGRATGFDRDRKNRRQDSRQAHPPSAPPSSRPPSAPPQSAPPLKRLPGKRTWLVVGAAAVTAAIIVGAVLIVGGGAAPSSSSDGVTTTPTSGGAGATGGPPLPATSPAAASAPPTAAAPAAATAPSTSSGAPGTSAPGGTLGTIGSSAGDVPAVGAATGANSAHTLGSPHAAVSTPPAYLDPGRVAGFREMLVGPAWSGSALVHCAGGGCVLNNVQIFMPPTPYRVGAPAIDETYDAKQNSLFCGVHEVLHLALDPATGGYRGSQTNTVTAGSCADTVVTVQLLPIVGPEASSIPAGTPAALNPLAITGYGGPERYGADQDTLNASCAGGQCVLECTAWCSTPLWFTAAAPTWKGVTEVGTDGGQCPKGTATVNLVRDGRGNYSGRATIKRSGKADPGSCPSSVTISLKPVTS